jgi:hypothetical protein
MVRILAREAGRCRGTLLLRHCGREECPESCGVAVTNLNDGFKQYSRQLGSQGSGGESAYICT